MKHLVEYIAEATSDVKKIIGGLFKFNKETTDEEIIDTILRDFTTKCASVIKDTAAPNCGLNSLYTYDLFFQRYGVPNGGDVSTEKIYSEIPSDRCAELFAEMFPDLNYFSEDEFKKMFDSGEFPVIQIWKGYHKGRDEIHVTYSITR